MHGKFNSCVNLSLFEGEEGVEPKYPYIPLLRRALSKMLIISKLSPAQTPNTQDPHRTRNQTYHPHTQTQPCNSRGTQDRIRHPLLVVGF
mmetsp:Transcript_9742/g.36259  ORF Transcript_9742/g.36259 Transcript_9742/m.36259 type:complete len:90 (+) Transcript_9742:482-751(+)